ncbi:polyketide synthase dehydratase domain-containing protein [Clostridium felsineum]|uniref:polyketide synthase dehydratase domain-containing protein n=1 Tax=Clostridium felsineum TaxID=36839 RepID=UPI00098C5A1A|nr:polyketide synthase dehydratase domain-containing protein [Clostridium felsineum]URZ16109.1 hypothetical protein CLFE_021560 [Clostridium felsineum DSM 794]
MESKVNEDILSAKLPEDKYAHLRNSILSFKNNSLSIRIDSQIQSYLKDHVFGVEAFVPATMIIEILFESALYYCEYHLNIDVSKLKPSKMEQLRILRALKMKPGNSIDVDIQFNKLVKNENEIYMEITIASNRVNTENKVVGRKINVTSKVVLSDKAYEPIKVNIPKCHYNYYKLPKNQFYKDYFPSLGPLFQTSCAKFAIDDSRTFYVAEYDCNNNEERFIEGQKSSFVTSPLGNDSCLQAAVFFSRIINLIGRLPIGGEELYFYRDHVRSGKVNVFVEKVEIDNDMKCNIYSYDSKGVIFHAKNFIVRKSPYHKLMDRQAFENNIKAYKVEPFEL